jgi:hypothetical protein
MAIYSSFFLCDSTELPRLFRGWRPPRTEPVVRDVKNPYTGEVRQISTREPDWSDSDHESINLDYRVVAIEGDYYQYLETRLPDEVRALRWRRFAGHS